PTRQASQSPARWAASASDASIICTSSASLDGKPMPPSLSQTAATWTQGFFFRQSKPCYNQHEGQVIYLEDTPPAPLDRCIRMLWYARVDHASHSRERILPTGRVQIILNLARDFLLDCPDGHPAE